MDFLATGMGEGEVLRPTKRARLQEFTPPPPPSLPSDPPPPGNDGVPPSPPPPLITSAVASVSASVSAGASAATLAQRQLDFERELPPLYSFEKLGFLGDGAFGKVYLARDVASGALVALKKLRLESASGEGCPRSVLRELRMLRVCAHAHVLRLREVVWGVDARVVFLVLDYYAYDLRRLLERHAWHASLAQSKWLVWQLLEALAYLHDVCHVMHRDLKSENVLVDARGHLVLADFGLARPCARPSVLADESDEGAGAYTAHAYTPLVVTLWYRAPELLLGPAPYGAAVDVWSLGCIVAELLRGHVLFAAPTELAQLERIHEVLGSPTPERWPTLHTYPGHAVLAPLCTPPRPDRLPEALPPHTCTPETLALLRAALHWDPLQRATAEALLSHAWWHELPHADANIDLDAALRTPTSATQTASTGAALAPW